MSYRFFHRCDRDRLAVVEMAEERGPGLRGERFHFGAEVGESAARDCRRAARADFERAKSREQGHEITSLQSSVSELWGSASRSSRRSGIGDRFREGGGVETVRG